MDSKGNAKICDFGACFYLSPGKKLRSLVGTPQYIAPEMYEGSYNHLVDFWSLGIFIYRLFTGEFPFNDNAPFSTLEKSIRANTLPKLNEIRHKNYPDKEEISFNGLDFISAYFLIKMNFSTSYFQPVYQFSDCTLRLVFYYNNYRSLN